MRRKVPDLTSYFHSPLFVPTQKSLFSISFITKTFSTHSGKLKHYLNSVRLLDLLAKEKRDIPKVSQKL